MKQTNLLKSLITPFTLPMTRIQLNSYQMKMKISIFLALFLVIISCAQAISNEDEERSLIQSNEQARELNIGTISLPFFKQAYIFIYL
jgi:hypothetical protein